MKIKNGKIIVLLNSVKKSKMMKYKFNNDIDFGGNFDISLFSEIISKNKHFFKPKYLSVEQLGKNAIYIRFERRLSTKEQVVLANLVKHHNSLVKKEYSKICKKCNKTVVYWERSTITLCRECALEQSIVVLDMALSGKSLFGRLPRVILMKILNEKVIPSKYDS